MGASNGDGKYWIDPANDGKHLKVFCDMTTDGGKTTKIFFAYFQISTTAEGNYAIGVILRSVQNKIKSVTSLTENKPLQSGRKWAECTENLHCKAPRFFIYTTVGFSEHTAKFVNCLILQYFYLMSIFVSYCTFDLYSYFNPFS